MRDNSKSRNQKRRWLEGHFIGENYRKGITIWEGFSYQEKKLMWKKLQEQEDKKRYKQMPQLSLLK